MLNRLNDRQSDFEFFYEVQLATIESSEFGDILVPRAHVCFSQRQDTKLWNSSISRVQDIRTSGLKHGVQR